MQIYSRLPLFHQEGSSSGRCKGVQDTRLQSEEEAGGSNISWGEDIGDIAKTVSVKKILVALSDVTGCPPLELISFRKPKQIMPYRYLLYLLARELSWQSYTQIGKTLNRDHTTILHGAKKGQKLIENNPEVEKVYSLVKKKLVA